MARTLSKGGLWWIETWGTLISSLVAPLSDGGYDNFAEVLPHSNHILAVSPLAHKEFHAAWASYNRGFPCPPRKPGNTPRLMGPCTYLFNVFGIYLNLKGFLYPFFPGSSNTIPFWGAESRISMALVYKVMQDVRPRHKHRKQRGLVRTQRVQVQKK